jgi:DNA-binding MarR family transcriptional regulator
MGDQVASVREFHRSVTERVGALRDDYLGRSRSLGASRVLWEVGHGVGEVRSLRARLELDSGYLSRLLRGLESEGLVTVGPAAGDGRVRVVSLTDQGRREVELLDAESDTLAESMLAPLGAAQREQLVAAMGVVQRLLTAGLVQVDLDAPDSDDARFCLEAYAAELDARFETGFDPVVSRPAAVDGFTPPSGFFLIARLRSEPVGCGGVTLAPAGHAEIRKMWVGASTRGLGVGRRLLGELEQRAAERGATSVRLETNRSLTEAIGLYRSCGYREVPPFNDEPFADHWFEKAL